MTIGNKTGNKRGNNPNGGSRIAKYGERVVVMGFDKGGKWRMTQFNESEKSARSLRSRMKKSGKYGKVKLLSAPDYYANYGGMESPKTSRMKNKINKRGN